jgi:hypothetical protein
MAVLFIGDHIRFCPPDKGVFVRGERSFLLKFNHEVFGWITLEISADARPVAFICAGVLRSAYKADFSLMTEEYGDHMDLFHFFVFISGKNL